MLLKPVFVKLVVLTLLLSVHYQQKHKSHAVTTAQTILLINFFLT
jgi:hypothetical protein